jgi:hypothetical protein
MSSDLADAVVDVSRKAPKPKKKFFGDTRKFVGEKFGDTRRVLGERYGKAKEFYKTKVAIVDDNFFIRNSIMIFILAGLMIAIGFLITYFGYDKAPPDSQAHRLRAAYALYGIGGTIIVAMAILYYYQTYV